MRKSLLMLLASSALAVAGNASAMPVGSPAVKPAAAAVNPVERAAVYIVEGNRYCFYFEGWRGPGWYRCGFAHRRGLGWGGVYGWQGWRYGPADRRFGGRVTIHEGRNHRDGVRGRTTIREGARERRGDREGTRGNTTIREGRQGATVRGQSNIRRETTGSGVGGHGSMSGQGHVGRGPSGGGAARGGATVSPGGGKPGGAAGGGQGSGSMQHHEGGGQ